MRRRGARLGVGVALALAAAIGAGAAAEGAKEASAAAGAQALERRAMRLAEELRCLVCQNQTIADSHAPLAEDLKQQIREQLRAGRSDEQIRGFMVGRYGEFVLYKPPLKPATVLLWAGPFVILVLALGGLVVHLRRRREAPVQAELSDEDRARLAALLEPGGEARR